MIEYAKKMHKINNYCVCAVQETCGSVDTIRLSSDGYGRLEVCSSGVWGTVCGNEATNSVAYVVCRELNHAAIGWNTH